MIDRVTDMLDQAGFALSSPEVLMCIVAGSTLLVLAVTAALRRPEHLLGRWTMIGGSGLSCAAAIGLIVLFSDPMWTPQDARQLELYRWLSISGKPEFLVSLALRVDALAAVLLATTTLVSFFVAISSPREESISQLPLAGSRAFPEMDGGPLRHIESRSAATLLLFATVMTVLSANFLQLYLFWQLQTVAASLLAGLWRGDSRSPAARKLLLANRTADIALAAGVCMLWVNFGTLQFADILSPASLSDLSERKTTVIGGICFCLFGGAIGKCAQIPGYVWVHGVSGGSSRMNALLFAATLPLAGVYLIVRCMPLFAVAANAQLLIALIGAFTALLAAAIAMAQSDLNRVLAFSTSSVIGLVFLGLGTGSPQGIVAAVYLLAAHALAMSLLHLASDAGGRVPVGSVNFDDPSGSRFQAPAAYWTFLIGALMLVCGLWGQHAIVDSVWQTSPTAVTAQQTLLSSIALLSCFLTALAIFRGFFLTFHGRIERPHGTGGIDGDPHKHSRNGTQWPLVVLAIIAVVSGPLLGSPLLGGPHGILESLLSRANVFTPQAVAAINSVGGQEPAGLFGIGLSLPVSLLGVVIAWMLYAPPREWPDAVQKTLGPYVRLSQNRFYLEEFYDLFLLRPFHGLAAFCRFADRVLIEGGLVGVIGKLPDWAGRAAAPLENGSVQLYALAMLFAASVLLFVLLWMGG